MGGKGRGATIVTATLALAALALMTAPAGAQGPQPPQGCTPCECGSAFCSGGETYWLRVVDVNATRTSPGRLTVTWTTELWTYENGSYKQPWTGGDGVWGADVDIRIWNAGNGTAVAHHAYYDAPMPGTDFQEFDVPDGALDTTVLFERGEYRQLHVPAEDGTGATTSASPSATRESPVGLSALVGLLVALGLAARGRHTGKQG